MKQTPDFPFPYRPGRHRTRAAARLMADGECLNVTLLDISRDGAKISLPYPIMPGTAVHIVVGDDSLSALVHWSRDGQAGVRFLDRPDIETLTALENGTSAP